MSTKDQQAGGPANTAQDHQGRHPTPRPRAATGLAAGSAMFSRMPSYTPVTRASEQPYPQDPGYGSQPESSGYSYGETAQGGAYQGEQYSDHQDYADQPSYGGQDYAAEGYGAQAYAASENYDATQPYYEDETGYASEGYDQPAYDDQAYGQGAYPDSSQQVDQGYGQSYQDVAYQNGSYHETGASEDEPLDLDLEEAQNYAAQPSVEQSFEAYGDASGYAGSDQDHAGGYGQYGSGDAYDAGQDQAAYSNGQAYGDQVYDPNAYAEGAYNEAQYPEGQYAPQDAHHAVQPYEAAYDQAPEIPLSYGQSDAGYQDPESQADADFMGTESGDGKKFGAGIFSRYMGRRSTLMLGSAVVGAIALGGALAFAFKQSGGGVDGEPPLIAAENTPVKEVPADPGGKEFPNKNKLIYDRLENGDQPDADRLVPRQEELALPNMPAQTDMPNMPELAANDIGGADGGAAAESADPESGPRKVQTLTVRPDGSIDTGQATESAGAQDAQQPEPTTTASIQPQAPQPEGAPAAASRQYVVQVASKKDQTEALAAFADMQQKYPSLLANYRPMVQRVNLGEKGVWYRLQVGPMTNETDASQLCGQLKSQGLSDCLVMVQ